MGKQFQQGYIALMSAIIILATLVLVSVSLSSVGMISRYNALGAESKARSLTLAEGCMNFVRFKLAENPSYSLAGDVAIGADKCSVVNIQHNLPAPGQTTIEASAVINRAKTSLSFVVDSSLTLLSWQESP